MVLLVELWIKNSIWLNLMYLRRCTYREHFEDVLKMCESATLELWTGPVTPCW